MSDQDILDRAHKAQKLIDDPLLSEAFSAVRAAIYEGIEQTPIRDRDGLHEWRLMLKLLKDVKANLDEAVRSGQVVAFRTKQRESLIQRTIGKIANAR
jgi:hypothetical protein